MDDQGRRDLSQSVLGDLQWLSQAELFKGDEQVLRESSGRLRRLLIDGSLQLCRKQVLGLRGEPNLSAPTLVDTTDPSLQHAQAGGAEINGLSVEGVRVWNRALGPLEIKRLFEDGLAQRSTPRPVRMSAWLSETCVVASGIKASRRDVIKFVANKLGGVHFDVRRDLTKDPAYGALDHARTTMRLADVDAAYHELASIAQQVVSCQDVLAVLTALERRHSTE